MLPTKPVGATKRDDVAGAWAAEAGDKMEEGPELLVCELPSAFAPPTCDVDPVLAMLYFSSYPHDAAPGSYASDRHPVLSGSKYIFELA
jgi:hypothetical protein